MLRLFRASLQALIFLSLVLSLEVPKLRSDRILILKNIVTNFSVPLSLFPSEGLSVASDSTNSLTLRQNICDRNLEGEIDNIIARAGFDRARVGILIQTLGTQKTIYAKNANKYFLPASNAKLLTTAAALSQLGPEYRFRTSVYGEGNSPNLATLRVVGSGDPSLNDDRLADLSFQLRKRGIRRISRLIIDNSRTYINPTWEWSDVREYYAVGVYGLNLNENAVILTILPQRLGEKVRLDWSDAIAAQQWRVENQAVTAPANTPYKVEITGVLAQPILKITGELPGNWQPDVWGLAIPDVPQYFLASFRNSLGDRGIEVNSATVVERDFSLPLGRKLATITSENLATLIAKTNQESNNLYAEALFIALEKELNAENPTKAIETVLTRLGVAPDSYTLVDGSGLSRQNLVSPEAIVQTLQLMAKTPEASIYRNSLAVAGASGTLKNRFVNTPLRGKLQAKTGTLTGVSGLSGYLELPNRETLVFSIILNQAESKTSQQRRTIDRIVLLLQDLSSCQGEGVNQIEAKGENIT